MLGRNKSIENGTAASSSWLTKKEEAVNRESINIEGHDPLSINREPKDHKRYEEVKTMADMQISTQRDNDLSKQGKTVIGEHISIEGDIRGKEDLLIEGSVKGSVVLDGCHLTVGSNGKVEADLCAEDVTISGRVVGNVTALSKVKITKEANLNGEIKTKRISVEEGACIKAAIDMEQESQKQVLPLSKIAGKVDNSEEDKKQVPLPVEAKSGE
jgi:cytoskeletal protein CcmA (bactofilin family)